MAKKNYRKISCETVCHGTFIRRLLYISPKYDNSHIIICKEDYTTRTCGACGHINNSVGDRKTFKCTSGACDLVIDRDLMERPLN